IPISPMYRNLMEGRVVPLRMDAWREALAGPWDYYGLLGLPTEKFDRTRCLTVTGSTLIGGARPVLIFGEETDAVPAIRPTPRQPWLAIKLRDKGQIKDISGMSGGAILGFRQCTDNKPVYTAVGIQSFWNESTRTAFATPMARVMAVFEA